jgi:O-antigen/teichoic acid export membrane protein
MVYSSPTVPTSGRIPPIAAALAKFAGSAQALAIADQIIVSGASFAATLLVGRTNSAALGEYSIAVSLVALVLAVQNALVLLPFTIRQHRTDAEESVDPADALALSMLLSGAAMALCFAGALTLAVVTTEAAFAALTVMLAAVMPFVVLREFARRYALAQLRMRVVLALDIAAAALQIVALGALAMFNATNAVTACAALGLSCVAPALVWRVAARKDLGWRVHRIRQSAARSWALGKWLILGQLTVQVQSYVVYWLAIFIAGAAMTGVYAACVSIIGFANPVVFGVGNVLTPKLARAWQRGGGAGVRREAQKNALLLGILVAIFCALVAVAGESVMYFLFPGDEYRGHGAVLSVLALALLATAIGMPASNALASMERPRAIVVVGGLGAAATVVLTAIFMSGFGLIGAAYGYLAGCMIGAAGRWVAFLSVSRRASDPVSSTDVVRTITGLGDATEITRIGGGDHAAVYALSPPGSEPVVVKLYRDHRAPAMAQLEFDALAGLAAALNNREFCGWTIRVPVPLSLSHAPLALTMRQVPGKPLQLCGVEGRQVLLREAGEAFTAAMQIVWGAGVKHGDLGLRNLMFDLDTRSIAILDPAAEECEPCLRGPSVSAAALDLGHLIAELTTDVNDLVGATFTRMHKQIFVAAALHAALREAGAKRAEFMEELRSSVAAHIEMRLVVTASPRGLWNALVRSVAERRIAELLDQFEQPEPAQRAA